ncbi:NAD(P)-dependent alcohol dehydrogenase [Ktedonosporobacter rubrisoli]|uniref:NAD(P)-dependent alcohol dehydrogenase n=1 Tax=Ktedonosporobacter rubrisoli TaxID=2509675 RepID=A0A4P6K3V6_KTERU|nr:NAD(P)-dependent alcohol dehydrogenase [Ktedonosporobacter rubrisoli]QBD82603.1 NAD(P)-dependent alcohol dehydrogenase [Ktedonosporobacter rubrisoli]
MKAYEIQHTFGIDSLALAERPQPQPGPEQVLVRVRAASLNFHDLAIVLGIYDPHLPLPLVPLSDGAGEVVAVGDAVSRVKVGDRVAGLFTQKWLAGDLTAETVDTTLGGPYDGVLQEYIVLPEDGVVKIPEHMTYEEASTLPIAALTAWSALFVQGDLKAGQTVLLQGTGGVSLFALQFARLAGARVIVISSSNEKLERVRALGADELINYREVPDWPAKARELTNGKGVDLLVDVTGNLQQSVKAVAVMRQISMVGFLGQTAVQIENIIPILQGNIRLQGVNTGHRESFEAMNMAIAQHRLRPVIDRIFPFEEAVEAFRFMQSGKYFGKICIRLP